jgi:hypothetical protein
MASFESPKCSFRYSVNQPDIHRCIAGKMSPEILWLLCKGDLFSHPLWLRMNFTHIHAEVILKIALKVSEMSQNMWFNFYKIRTHFLLGIYSCWQIFLGCQFHKRFSTSSFSLIPKPGQKAEKRLHLDLEGRNLVLWAYQISLTYDRRASHFLPKKCWHSAEPEAYKNLCAFSFQLN